jgi:hypothetical protein
MLDRLKAMLPPHDPHKITREQRVGLVLLVVAAVAALGGLAVISQPQVPGVPAVNAPLFWLSPTPQDLAQAPTASVLASPTAVDDQSPPDATATPNTLPPWLSGPSTPTRPNEPGPTSTPSAYFVFLPGLNYDNTATPVRPTEPPPAPPTPRWPDGLSSQTASKLGLHVVANNDPYIMEYVRRVRPRVMKSVDDLGWLAEVKQASPNTVTVGRISNQNETWPEQLSPEEAAKTYIDMNLFKYRANTGVDYWEGWNEFVPVTTARWKWFAAFEAARACDMQALGLHAAVGGFPAGAPEFADMALFMPALQAAHRCGAIFTLHEVVTPLPGCGIFNGTEAVIPGAPLIPGKDVGYTSLRYRFWYEAYLKPAGIGDLPLVISELAVGGIVPGQSCNGPGGESWKDYVDYWVQNGVGPDGPQSWTNLLAWYDSELRQDPYVIGTTIFTAGAIHDPRWSGEDLHDVIIPLAYYETSQK